MTAQPFRLASGGLIDRSRPVRFTFNGLGYMGQRGDTAASALLANGVHMVARSFKYHRPRGIVGAGSEDPAALVQVGTGAATDPNCRVTELEIYDGLDMAAQNCWPSLGLDVGVVNDLASRFLPPGFYNKTFMGPPLGWKVFEPIIRHSAGMGVSPRAPDPDHYEAVNRHCDVLVIGAGPAGLMAALSAARSGARVILAEETARLGGRLLSLPAGQFELSGNPPVDWVDGVEAELRRFDDVSVLTRTCAIGYYSQNFVTLWEKVSDHIAPGDRNPRQPRQRLWRIRAKQVVLATGAIERPLVFHQNDRPGIMLASAVRTYLHRYGVCPGRSALIFANNDSAWQTAFDLQDCGGQISAIVDVRSDPAPGLTALAAERGIAVHAGSAIAETSGRRQVHAARVAKLDGAGGLESGSTWIDADLVAVSGGWSPNVALFSQSRGKLRYDDEIAAFRPGVSWQNERSAGAANGEFRLDACLTTGAQSGAAAAREAGFDAQPAEIPRHDDPLESTYGISAHWEVPSNKKRPRAFVDLQDDVTAKDLKLAVAEGYRSVEHAKRYTTTGMGTDQGKIANLNAFGILAKALQTSIPEVGTTTFRQPYKPVTFGALAGQHVGENFHPRRTTAMHDWHVDAGAIFETVGDWYRPWVYPRDGETPQDALMRESKAARASVGVLDASTLGKIDIRGRDAREFLNRVYTNAWMKLAPGRCRYGLMLGEDGMVSDDGVTACLADDHFHMTTTTGGAASVLTVLEDYLQTEWPELEVYLTSTTEQSAVISLCGPNSDKVVKAVLDDFDPDPASFEFMTWRDGTAQGIPVRVFRISFTGELSYEINISATYGRWLWERVMTAGADYDITPYGTEAMHLLRAEKGFIIVGQETDGTVTPADLQMDWIVSKKKPDFIGRRSLFRADTVRPDRKQLVGLLTEDPQIVLAEGAHVIDTASEPAPPVPMLGHITSSYFSPNLDRSIALGLIKNGGARLGETVYVTCGGGQPIATKITGTDFMSGEIGA